jgi:23S rRNA pseudouridine1911/1915/1917 synthase
VEKTKNFCLQVGKEDKGLRLDQYIIKNLDLAISRSRIQQLIREQKITVNGKSTKAHYKVKEEDKLSIAIPAPESPAVLPENIPLDIVFEDEDILVINKPEDMVTHPASGNYSRTLVNALLYYGCSLSTINGPTRPGIVHRLDKDTSGLMVVAKNDFAHQKLAKQFQKHTVERKYVAIVKGRIEHDQGVIDYPLARDPRHRQQFTVSFSKSKDALTRYRVLKRYKKVTLLELAPHTGRTHQLRVHLKFLGYPILGDTRYGKSNDFQRMALHATVLGFQHPRTGEFVQFHSDVPGSFSSYLQGFQ